MSRFALLVICIVSLTGFTYGQTKRINFKAEKFYPEGLAYNPNTGNYFVSSVKTGEIGKVDPSGNFTSFYKDSSLKSAYGMKVDLKRNKLWVCSGDANFSKYSSPDTYKKMIRLIGLDLSSGNKTDDVDLSKLFSGEHFANDLTLDNAGNIYITDSYSPVIYKVDGRMNASVFARNEKFNSIEVGLNGIAFHPDGFLIVANNSDGNLYKVDIKDPSKVMQIMTGTFFVGADGLILENNGSLVLIQNKGVHKVFKLASTDKWQSAKVSASTLAADKFDQPTTGIMKGSEVQVLNSKIKDLKDPVAAPSSEFSIQLARFISMN